MEKPVKEILQGLKGHSSRSKQSVVSENLGEIERLISEGVPVAVIWESLRVGGLELTFPSFQTSLHRARKKREGSLPLANQAGPAQASTAPARPQNLPPVSSPLLSVGAPSAVSIASEVPTEPIILEMRAELQAFKESIKHLSDREKRKLLSEFHEKQHERLKIHRMVNKTK
jgi:hypothetical protein